MSRWGDPQTVAGFYRSEPNSRLVAFVERELNPGGPVIYEGTFRLRG